MLQDVFLFSGTIRSNIILREEGISDEEIMDVCHYVNADQFINKLDHGLDEPGAGREETTSPPDSASFSRLRVPSSISLRS